MKERLLPLTKWHHKTPFRRTHRKTHNTDTHVFKETRRRKKWQRVPSCWEREKCLRWHLRPSSGFARLVVNLFHQTDNFWLRQDARKTLKNIWSKMQRFSKGIKTPLQTLPYREGTHTNCTPTQAHARTHTRTHPHTHQETGRHAFPHAHKHGHLKANADTQTLVHCSLKLSLCVDFSGLLNLVWGQRRCPLDSFMQCSRFSGGRRDVSNSSHGHSTIR